jgi:hypothetical protein
LALVANLLPAPSYRYRSVANLLIPVVHLDLQKSPRILKKFEMTLKLFSGAWGKMIYEKT